MTSSARKRSRYVKLRDKPGYGKPEYTHLESAAINLLCLVFLTWPIWFGFFAWATSDEPGDLYYKSSQSTTVLKDYD